MGAYRWAKARSAAWIKTSYSLVPGSHTARFLKALAAHGQWILFELENTLFHFARMTEFEEKKMAWRKAERQVGKLNEDNGVCAQAASLARPTINRLLLAL